MCSEKSDSHACKRYVVYCMRTLLIWRSDWYCNCACTVQYIFTAHNVCTCTRTRMQNKCILLEIVCHLKCEGDVLHVGFNFMSEYRYM